MAISHNIMEQVKYGGVDCFRNLPTYWLVIDCTKALVLI